MCPSFRSFERTPPSSPFRGLWVPLVTPFDDGGAVDLVALRLLVRRLAAAGVHGFVVGGTTGEPAALTVAERAAVLDLTLEEAAGRPVIVGAGGLTAAEVIEDMSPWRDRPLAGYLVAAPAYVRPSQAALVRHLTAVADGAPHPVVLYDIPYRTGVPLVLDTLRALACHPRIVALKDCGGDAAKTLALIADGDLAVLAGEDAQVFTTLCLGGAGAITASAHVHAEGWVALVRAVLEGRLDEGRRWHHALAPLADALFAEPNPAPVKAVMARLGWMGPGLRAPHLPASDEAAEQAWAAWCAVAKVAGGLQAPLESTTPECA